jgi:hypothetical protein
VQPEDSRGAIRPRRPHKPRHAKRSMRPASVLCRCDEHATIRRLAALRLCSKSRKGCVACGRKPLRPVGTSLIRSGYSLTRAVLATTCGKTPGFWSKRCNPTEADGHNPVWRSRRGNGRVGGAARHDTRHDNPPRHERLRDGKRPRLVVLRHKTGRMPLLNLRAQHGHLGSALAIATIKR